MSILDGLVAARMNIRGRMEGADCRHVGLDIQRGGGAATEEGQMGVSMERPSRDALVGHAEHEECAQEPGETAIRVPCADHTVHSSNVVAPTGSNLTDPALTC